MSKLLEMMATRADRVVVVADSSNLGHRAFARICTVGDIDTLVTDSTATAEQTAPFADAGVKVIRA